MHPIFRITSADIKALNDGQARELVSRLCKEELMAKRIGTDAVTWGGDQRAIDGGVDVRVEIVPYIGISGYIPKDSTVFQVKAELFSSAKIPGEMAPKGGLRPAIADLASKGGAYIIVSTRDDVSDLSLSRRREAMAKCLHDFGLADKVHLDFYDSRRIADWAENTLGMVAWIKSEIGKPLEGWRAYGPWAYREQALADEYLVDEKVKIFLPNTDDAQPVLRAIDSIRADLNKGASSVRIVGLSGVGKTRLVQALFDPRIETQNPTLDQNDVLYTDLADDPTPQPSAMLEALILTGANSAVVIDNCGQEVHQRLTEIVKRADSKIRLVTVEYDIRENLPEGTSCYHMEGSSDEVIGKLLGRYFPNLSDLDVGKIVEFSDGNARVAFALASTCEKKGELAQLRDDALFKRLFVQKHIENDELQRCAEAASLLYSFDVDDQGDDSELATLARVAEVTVPRFYRHVAELQTRGLVQARGKWRAVLPHAISNRLALKAVQASPPGFLVENFVTKTTDRVARSFSRRLGYLHDSKHVQEIVSEWLKPEGLLGDVLQLGELRRDMLENIAPVNQRAALDAIRRAIGNSDFVKTTSSSREQAASLLRSLAYERELFHDAATSLSTLAKQAFNDTNVESFRGVVQSLFYLHLSGTLATPAERALFVRTLIFSNDATESALGLLLLRAALEAYHFSSSYSFDFGALKRSYGWSPKNSHDVQEWYSLFIAISIELGNLRTTVGANGRKLLGESFRSLWCYAGMTEALTRAASEFVPIDGWPDGWIGIRTTLNFDKEKMSPESLALLEGLEKQVAPKDLRARIVALILSSASFTAELGDADNDEDGGYEKALINATALGVAAAKDETVLPDIEIFLSSDHHTNKIFSFALGLGQASKSPCTILSKVRAIIERKAGGVGDLQFVTGLIKGWNLTSPAETAAFLDQALVDEVWGNIFPLLQLAIELDQEGYARLAKALSIGKAATWTYQALGYGRRTDTLNVSQISSILSLLKNDGDQGLRAAIDVLRMVIHCTDNKDEEYKVELQDYCASFVADLDWSMINLENNNFSHQLDQLIKYALLSASLKEVVVGILDRLFRKELYENRYPRRLGNFIAPFFEKFPIEAMDAIYAHAQPDAGRSSAVSHMLKFSMDRHGDTAISAVPELALIQWCAVSPENRCLFVASTCRLFDRPKAGGLSDEAVDGISRVAQRVLNLAPNRKPVFEIFSARLHPTQWSGSRAAIMRQRLEFIDQFNPDDDPDLAVLIDDLKQRLLESIQNEELREREIERSSTGSFE